jgi:crotonobetainyl-CoA:carnitine CoA-transferase CaiB-like acyl-CoA transferase
MALTHHYQCKDGRFVHLSWLEGRQLGAFAKIAGVAENWDPEGLLDYSRVRGDRAFSERLRSRLAEVFRTRTAAEWMAVANPDADLAECLTSEEWLLYSEQARASGAVLSLVDPELGLSYQAGYPIAMSLTPASTPGPRHLLDFDRASVLEQLEQKPKKEAGPATRGSLSSALEGFRAVDATQLLAGPTACRILAEYGADVVQITNPRARAGREYHLATNSGKRTIMLDLKAPGGMEVFEALIRQADVFSTNFSSEVARRLGVDETAVRALRPDIIYSRISAYGHEGPLREFRGHDQVGQAITGMEVRWGRHDDSPLMQPNPVNDFGTGHLAAFAMLLALYHRLRTGHGQHVGASLAHTATFLQTPYMLAFRGKCWDEPGGQQCRGFAPLERLYQAGDRWFFLAARNVEELRGVQELADIQAESGEMLEAELSARFAKCSAAEWIARLAKAGVAAHALNTPAEAMQDPWALSHGLSRTVEFPAAGTGQVVSPAPRLSHTPMRAPKPAPPIGSDGEEVVRELGLGHRLADLVAGGAVHLPQQTAIAV